MGILKTIFNNTAEPRGFWGRLMARGMNSGHARQAIWGIGLMDIPAGARILDVGCGGGGNIARLLERDASCHVTGLDHSSVSVAESRALNANAVESGSCDVVQGGVQDLASLFPPASFDVVTVFETIYFWPDVQGCFRRVHDVLAPGGSLYVVNEEAVDTSSAHRWEGLIDGMSVYEPEDIVRMLRDAGFEDVSRTDETRRNWLCVRARRLR